MPFLNGFLDKRKPTYRDVAIVDYWESTYSGIIRTFSIEYRETETGITNKVAALPEKIDEFVEADLGFGVIEVKPGYFQMPWINDIYPLVLVPIPPEEINNVHGDYLSLELEPEEIGGATSTLYLKPMIELSPEKHIEPTDKMTKKAIDFLVSTNSPN